MMPLTISKMQLGVSDIQTLFNILNNYPTVYQQSDQLFKNNQCIMQENAMLKSENEKLKQQLALMDT